MARAPCRRRAAGFTLVELLVALFALALMAAMGWRGVDGILRARDASQDRLERMLRLDTVIAQWEVDIASLQSTNAAPPIAFDGQTLRMTRRTDTGVQVVAWTLAAAEEGTWMRWSGPAVTDRAQLQEQWLRSQQIGGAEPGLLRTIKGITDWQVYFFRNNAWTNPQSSGDVLAGAGGASAPVVQALPSGVRLVLEFAPASGFGGALTRDVALGPNQP
jgi:general secretion pathway protein J